LCKLRNLEELVIVYNGFWGPLPSCFSNMISLRVLDVSYNNFSGAIPSSLLSNLKSLEYIDFSRNVFEGSLLLASLANNSNLEHFHLIDNHNRLVVNTEEHTWFPSFQSRRLVYQIVCSTKTQYNLSVVRLSHNGMAGNFPSWLLDNNVNLEQLELGGNH
ncbi:hypothetical protein NL676_003748, partial [Syzygium grande]